MSGPHPAPVSHGIGRFPRTRYQGSKRKLAAAIVRALADLPFHTVLDAFGGTGAVAYAFKCAGKAVTYNDVLSANHQVGLALIENSEVRVDDSLISGLGTRVRGVPYGDFIERTFEGIYFTTEENRWLDTAVGNLARIECVYARALAWYSVFQAAIAKRPYNLFHRKNLYMRTADVARTFGNKASWDRGFDVHTASFAAEANAAVIDTGVPCCATRLDALAVPAGFDLVYIDTPYISADGVGVDYRDFYHFLEGLLLYDEWPELVDYESRHRRLLRRADRWSDRDRCRDAFAALFERHADSVIAVSYRSDGIPSIDDLSDLLCGVKRRVRVVRGGRYQYALSTNRRSREVLLIGTD